MARSDFESRLISRASARPPTRTPTTWPSGCSAAARPGFPKGVVHLHHDIPYTCETYAREILADHRGRRHVLLDQALPRVRAGQQPHVPVLGRRDDGAAARPPGPEGPARDRAGAAADRCSSRVPTLYGAMVNLPDAGDHDLSSVRMCVSAAEPLAPEVLRRWQQRFGLDIVDGIGSTEMLHIYCSNRPGDVRPGTSGKPVPGLRAAAARRARRAGRRRRGRQPARARRQRARLLLAPAREDQGRDPTASGSSPATATGWTTTATTSTRAAPTT